MKSEPLRIEYHRVDSLLVDLKNPRTHSNKQVQQIAKSIQAFGFNVPLSVDANLQVIAGHGRLSACKLLGIGQVPVIRLELLSEHQRRAFMIADNRLTENSEWNNGLLGEQLTILAEEELDFTLETIGFEMGEIDLIIENLAPPPEGQSDRADGLPEMSAGTQVSKAGDLWLLGHHRVYCGNPLNESAYVALMGNAKATMVFTDPRYNVPIDGHATSLGTIRNKDSQMGPCELSDAEFTDFLSRVCGLLASHSIDGSLHFICMDWRHVGELLAAGKHAYRELKNVCVWVKDNAGIGSLYRSQHELVLVFKHGKESHRNNVQLGQFGRHRSNVWHYAGVNSSSCTTEEGNLLLLSPTVKPTALIADAIMDGSARGDLILDVFLGGGTTILAAERTGRKCYGIELDSRYVDTIVRRWQAFTGLSAVHGISGKKFADLEREINDGYERQ